ncbi:hypothetical protein DFH07DRAFT_760681 [Mycena maculata]|uniref:Zn(2)-C6 fungal-type domain-containing protein n=1 Tax=Mycena maculata TaxID=230809 RepID=A0AAD7HI94_9AGAR|nr:hypothetical protein DFH07DRAFT_760681 [Mycena maculata]
MSTTTTAPDTTADKALSKVRAHKGNLPSLPQTKCCSLCSAKFTRMTHLNRHLRSHANERLHRCNASRICLSSKFTRSDLLTRHKRTCGQSVARSRRKSCEACAESKIKCDLQYPCTKCTSRGRECVFQNDPEDSRRKSSISRARSRKSPASTAAQPGEAHFTHFTPPSSSDRQTLAADGSSGRPSASPSPLVTDLPALSDSGSSGSSSPQSDDSHAFDEQLGFNTLLDIIDVYDYDPLGSVPFSFDAQMPLTCPRLSLFAVPDAIKSDSLWEINMVSSPLSFDVDQDTDLLDSAIRSLDSPGTVFGHSPYNHHLSISPPFTLDCLDAQDSEFFSGFSSSPDRPLDTYLHSFFTRFLAQVPLIHAATWKMADTPPMLVRIFRACGALFAKTFEAAMFVSETLDSVTAEISDEFDAKSNSEPHHMHLIIALVLLETISVGVFHEHNFGMNVDDAHKQMIRQTGLIRRVGSWTAPDWNNPILLEVAWMEWVQFATIKRALLLAYFHDCCHCMYSGSPPAFSPTELDVHLPCDDALWSAHGATEWFAVAHTPSPYGVGSERIYGVSMQRALAVLSTPNTDCNSTSLGSKNSGLRLPPFALFLLIHTVLRNISVAQRELPWFATLATQAPGGTDQVVLDNWLHLWLTSPEVASPAQQPPFVYNSLPFYWLAQVSLWKKSRFSPEFGESSVNVDFLLGGQWPLSVPRALRLSDDGEVIAEEHENPARILGDIVDEASL